MYVFARSGTVSAFDSTPTYSQTATIALGHKTGNGLLSNAPAPLNARLRNQWPPESASANREPWRWSPIFSTTPSVWWI
jgi:hypothetical protein